MDELADYCKTKHPRARKPHHCCECPRTIQPGELHAVTTMQHNGRWDSYRTCMGCEALWAFFKRYTDGICYVEGLGDIISEHHYDAAPELVMLGMGAEDCAREDWAETLAIMDDGLLSSETGGMVNPH